MPNKKKPDEKTKLKAKVEEIKERSKRRMTKIRSARGSAGGNTVTDNRLELLITTVNRSKAEFYIDLLQSFEVNMQFLALGHGTADAKMLSRFGLDTDSDKAVIFSVIQSSKLDAALSALDEKFRTIKNGKGVAYTLPMSSIIGTLIFGFLSNNRMAVKDGKENG